MKQKILILLLFVLTVTFGCDQATTGPSVTTTTTITMTTQTTAQESPCKDTPLAAECFVTSSELDFIPPVPDEYTILEDFDSEKLNQMPINWLIFSNEEYQPNGVFAKVVETDTNRYVQMYSDGQERPTYPQSAPTPTFIFTTKFNLDIDRKGIAFADVMVPAENRNSVTIGISTGAVNTISVTIDTDLSVFVKVGGPFYYYSQNGDGGDYYDTDIVAIPDTWYRFRFEWNAEEDNVKAYWIDGENEVLLFDGQFHISSRFNAAPDGEIMVPNVFRVTMPYGLSGYAYLDNVKVERMG